MGREEGEGGGIMLTAVAVNTSPTNRAHVVLNVVVLTWCVWS